MCGRFLLDADYEALIERYQIFEDIQSIYEKKIEIFPSEQVWSIAAAGAAYPKAIGLRTWGIRAKIGQKEKTVINGRSETMHEKAMFRNLQPCIIPATGYYEWDKVSHAKHRISSDSKLISFAGLYKLETQEVIILTVEAVSTLKIIHDRMPVMLSPEEEAKWLKAKALPEYNAEQMTFKIENIEPINQLNLFDRL